MGCRAPCHPQSGVLIETGAPASSRAPGSLPHPFLRSYTPPNTSAPVPIAQNMALMLPRAAPAAIARRLSSARAPCPRPLQHKRVYHVPKADIAETGGLGSGRDLVAEFVGCALFQVSAGRPSYHPRDAAFDHFALATCFELAAISAAWPARRPSCLPGAPRACQVIGGASHLLHAARPRPANATRPCPLHTPDPLPRPCPLPDPFLLPDPPRPPCQIIGGCAPAQYAPAANGLGLTMLIYAVGNASGAHLNPAVTLMLLLTKQIQGTKAICYMLAQVGGWAGVRGVADLTKMVLAPYCAPCVACIGLVCVGGCAQACVGVHTCMCALRGAGIRVAPSRMRLPLGP